MTDKECGLDRWIDEMGKPVVILTNFQHLYIDEELSLLSSRYDFYSYKGPIPSSLGSAGLEDFVSKILRLGSTNVGGNGEGHPSSLYGVSFTELYQHAMRAGCKTNYIRTLVDSGYLREKWVMGTLVIFPTELLLHNQKIKPRRV